MTTPVPPAAKHSVDTKPSVDAPTQPSSAVQPIADGQRRVDVATLVAEHHAELFRYAYRLTGSVHDAEDLTQQTFLTAQAKLDQLRDAACARSWLYAIVRNTYLKSRRQTNSNPTLLE